MFFLTFIRQKRDQLGIAMGRSCFNAIQKFLERKSLGKNNRFATEMNIPYDLFYPVCSREVMKENMEH